MEHHHFLSSVNHKSSMASSPMAVPLPVRYEVSIPAAQRPRGTAAGTHTQSRDSAVLDTMVPWSHGGPMGPSGPQIFLWLVVWNMNFIFHNIYIYIHIYIWDVILPIDFHSMIFQDGEIAPPSSIVWGEYKPTFTTRPWGHHHPELRWFLPPSPRSGKLRCAWRASPWLSAAWWRQRKTGEENGDRKWRFHGDLSNKKW